MRYTLFCSTTGRYCVVDHRLAKASVYSFSLASILNTPNWHKPVMGGNSYQVLQGTYPESRILARFDDFDTFIYDHPELFI